MTMSGAKLEAMVWTTRRGDARRKEAEGLESGRNGDGDGRRNGRSGFPAGG